jgi:CDP-6-deoxy-D-xylo-4-hexulose-3-dehydrase
VSIRWPLMHDCVTDEDIQALIGFLASHPRLTQGEQVRALEAEWSSWLGVEHSVFVNSGASANMVTLAALRALHGPGGEVVVSPLNWVSDIAAVMQAGFQPVFADIELATLSMATDAILERIGPRTRAVLLTHLQGFDAITEGLLSELEARGIPLLEDVCESHGASHRGRRLGSIGLASNFSFYFAHHMTTVEGGMICTSDPDLHQAFRVLRSHGMVREASDPAFRARYERDYPECHPEFLFAWPAFNVRNTELGAVLGRSQLARLDASNRRRSERFAQFVAALDPDRWFTDFRLEGSCNYAFNLITRQPDAALFERAVGLLRERGVELRRGSAGGGNQLRQPYLRHLMTEGAWLDYPATEHVHHYGLYFGNHDEVSSAALADLCEALNRL